MNPVGAFVPTYEEAHRAADTLFPHHSWTVAQDELVDARLLFRCIATTYGADLRFNLSAKHPHPACVLAKRVGRFRVEVQLWAKFPDTDTLDYMLGVTRTPLFFSFFGARPRYTELAGISSLQLHDQKSLLVMEDLIERQLSAG